MFSQNDQTIRIAAMSAYLAFTACSADRSDPRVTARDQSDAGGVDPGDIPSDSAGGTGGDSFRSTLADASVAGNSSGLVGEFTGGANGLLSSSTGLASGDTDDRGTAGAASASDSERAYANVTAVTTSASGSGFVFGVSIESSDIDCTEYANWWEILGEDGSLIYRRILDHSHTDANGTTDADAPGNTFTRSSAPDSVPVTERQIVVVRAHVNSAGYQGVAMRGSVAQGFARAVDITSAFASAVEAQPPQPQSCLF